MLSVIKTISLASPNLFAMLANFCCAGTKTPLLGQGGEAVAIVHGGGGSNGSSEAKAVAGSRRVPPPVASSTDHELG